MSIPLPTAPAEPRPVFTLTAADRCDARECDARAYVRTIVTLESDLVWCLHHSREVEPVLRPLALGWVDESEAILA